MERVCAHEWGEGQRKKERESQAELGAHMGLNPMIMRS